MNDYIISSTFDPSDMQSDTLIISCSRVEQELAHAIAATGCPYPVIYLKSRLHDVPTHLMTALQEVIDEVSDAGIRKIFMGYATCGNALVGLHTRKCDGYRTDYRGRYHDGTRRMSSRTERLSICKEQSCFNTKMVRQMHQTFQRDGTTLWL